MLDINLLRNDIEAVAARLAGRGYTLDTAAFNQLESDRKSLQTRMQELQVSATPPPSRSAWPRARVKTCQPSWPK